MILLFKTGAGICCVAAVYYGSVIAKECEKCYRLYGNTLYTDYMCRLIKRRYTLFQFIRLTDFV